MRESLVRLSESAIREVVDAIPLSMQHIVLPSIQANDRCRFDPVRGERERARYCSGNGMIIVYGFSRAEIECFDYVDIVLHEIGHKIFGEMLNQEQRSAWMSCCSHEGFVIELSDIYMLREIREEEFSIVFSVVYLQRFLRRKKMKKSADRVRNRLEEISERSTLVERLVEGAGSTHPEKRGGVCYQRIHERVRRFLFGDMTIREFEQGADKTQDSSN